MVAAVSQPGVSILGHPQGRVFNMRLGVLADWSKVFEVAARRQVAIEIDGSWARQDVPYELAAQALEQGCIFALDSDAHSHPRVRLRRHRDCTRQARRHPAGADRQLLVREEIPASGRPARGIAKTDASAMLAAVMAMRLRQSMEAPSPAGEAVSPLSVGRALYCLSCERALVGEHLAGHDIGVEIPSCGSPAR